jgi:cyanophycin synthetase
MREKDTPQSAQYVLRDPVEFVVFGNRRGVLGLGFSICDIGITNIQEDHLGISDIHSGRFAKVKGLS